MKPRVLIAGLFHETHTFLEGETRLADFQIRHGDELLACAGDSSPMGGALEFARAQGWEIVPAMDCRAVPSATVQDEVLETFWNGFKSAWRPDCDAVLLILHGAMVTRSHPDVEGEILSRIRRLIGPSTPVFGVYDLHANFSAAMTTQADCLVAYRENPHTDAREAAVRAAALLARQFTEGRPRMVLRQTAIVLPPTGTGTADEPMKSLAAAARAMEGGDIWAVNIAAGFAFADTPDTGLSFQIITRGLDEEAQSHLDALERLAESLKEHGRGMDEPLESVMARLTPTQAGLTVLVEPSDNIGGGAPGDCTGCLRALVAHKIQNAAVCINDPAAVTALQAVPIGGRLTLPIGGRGSRLDEGPLTLDVELVSRRDGMFELEDKQSHLASLCGDRFDMGACAVVRHAGLLLLLTSHKTAPFDLGQWRSQGIDPAQLSVIVVKAAVAHRRAYDPIAARSFWVDTPGPCSSNLKRFPFKHLRRPIWPLDEN